MNRLFLMLLTCVLTSLETRACDVCGCGVSNYHYGMLPQFQKNFVGLRYRYRSFNSELDASHAAPYSYETFQTAELWGRFYPLKRLQAFIFIPYNFNHRKEGEKVTTLQGLGDVMISANYNILNTYDSARPVKHNLLLGGGVKFPTGEFTTVQDGLTVNQNFQLGTGSIDFLFNAIYTVRYNKVGLNGEFTYAYKNTNKDEYRFGNTSQASVTAFYIIPAGAFSFMPNAGISAEFFKANKQYGEPFPDTSGWASLYNLGLESYFRSTALGFTFTNPYKQALFSGNVTAESRYSVHLTFMF